MPHSLTLSGTSAAAGVPASPDLNLTSDWTIETWFKDENPAGFNHEYVSVLNKGDIAAGSGGESPYFITLGYKRLLVGLRRTSRTTPLPMTSRWCDPFRWHHVAASFQASTRLLTLYLDGVQVASGQSGSDQRRQQPAVQLGRNGPVSGKYFMGKLDDTRLWNVVRSANDIKANMGSELSSAPTGLVANWKFDEGRGASAADAVHEHTATLSVAPVGQVMYRSFRWEVFPRKSAAPVRRSALPMAPPASTCRRVLCHSLRRSRSCRSRRAVHRLRLLGLSRPRASTTSTTSARAAHRCRALAHRSRSHSDTATHLRRRWHSSTGARGKRCRPR